MYNGNRLRRLTRLSTNLTYVYTLQLYGVSCHTLQWKPSTPSLSLSNKYIFIYVSKLLACTVLHIIIVLCLVKYQQIQFGHWFKYKIMIHFKMNYQDSWFKALI